MSYADRVNIPAQWRKEAWEYLCDNAEGEAFVAVNITAEYFRCLGYAPFAARDLAGACVVAWSFEPEGGLVMVSRRGKYRFYTDADNGKPKLDLRTIKLAPEPPKKPRKRLGDH